MTTPSTPSVLIQSLIRRAGGSEIPLYGKTYHFKPENEDDPKAPHVCLVDDPAAIHRFLAVPAGFALVDPNADLPPKPKAAPVQTIHTEKAEAAAPAAKVEPVTITGPDGEKVTLTDMDRPELTQFAQEKFAIKVHHKWSPATIIAKILEAMRAPGEDD